jgi:hypothetical protein
MCLRSSDGFPDVLVVDHAPKFTSEVFRDFIKSMGSTVIVGSAYHKNTNAKVERANGVIDDTLRAFANGSKDYWEHSRSTCARVSACWHLDAGRRPLGCRAGPLCPGPAGTAGCTAPETSRQASSRGLDDSCTVPVDGLACPPHNGPEKVSTASACTKVWTKAGARRSVYGAGLVIVPSASSEPARAANILAPLLNASERDRRCPAVLCPPGPHDGKSRRARRVASHPKKLLLTLRVRVPRRRRRSVAVLEAAARQRVNRVPRAGQVRHVEALVLDLVEPTNIPLVQMSVHLQPRDRLVVHPQVEIRTAIVWPRGAPTEQVVLENPQRVHQQQQLQDVRWVVPFRCRQFAALIRNWMLLPSHVVRLSQDCRERDVARVRRQRFASSRVEPAQHRRLGESRFSASKLACASGVHANRAVGLPSAISSAKSSA